MKKGTLNPENFISSVQVPLVEHIIEFCALKLHFDFCPINARKPLKYQGFSGFVLFGRTVMEAPPGIEPGIKVLQTSALPLGYGADK